MQDRVACSVFGHESQPVGLFGWQWSALCFSIIFPRRGTLFAAYRSGVPQRPRPIAAGLRQFGGHAHQFAAQVGAPDLHPQACHWRATGRSLRMKRRTSLDWVGTGLSRPCLAQADEGAELAPCFGDGAAKR